MYEGGNLMIDYTYTAGFDYDTVRSFPSNEAVRERKASRSFSMVQKMTMALLIFVASCALLLLTLQSIPFFDIQSVDINGTAGAVPPSLSVPSLQDKVSGASIFSFAPEHLNAKLMAHPLVRLSEVERKQHALSVSLSLHTPDMIMEGTGTDGQTYQAARIEGRFIEISGEDYIYLSQMIPSVSIEKKMGIELALGEGEQIAEVYLGSQVPSGNLDGNISLHIPQYHVSIDVREETSLNRLHTALQLIRLDSESDGFGYASPRGIWYDLSQQSLVEKQNTNRR